MIYISYIKPILWLVIIFNNNCMTTWPVWLNGRAFARDPKGRGFESRPVRFQVTALGKLLTHMRMSPSSIIWYRPMCSDALQLGR